MRSSSPRSKEIQAAETGACSSQVERRVVLPKPAGAAMSVSGRCMPGWSWFVRRGRGIRSGRTGGMASFVTRSNCSLVRPCVSPGGGAPREAGVFCICSSLPLRGTWIARRSQGNASCIIPQNYSADEWFSYTIMSGCVRPIPLTSLHDRCILKINKAY
jgi:putative hemolysin